jgi:hypothetical protein
MLLARPATASLHSGRQVVAGFHSDDDGYDHAIILQADGTIRETFYVSGSFHSGSPLTRYADATRIAGFYTDYDHVRHVIIARSGGQVDELYYGTWGISAVNLGMFGPNSITGVAGWVDGFNYYHAAVSLTNGDVRELQYGPLIGAPTWVTRYSFGGSVTVRDISGYSDYNANRIVAQLSSPTTSLAVIAWSGNSSATVGYVTQSTYPTGCNLDTASNVTAFDVGPLVGQDYLSWGTSGSKLCGLSFTVPTSGTQSDPASLAVSFGSPVVSVSGFAESFHGNYNVPHVVTALSNGAVYDVSGAGSGAGSYYLGSY